jgi:hypothetical protein
MAGLSYGVNPLAIGFLSEEKVSEIRDRSSILEVVSDYVTLKKAGKNHRGLCPFHSEKTPSFMVNEEKQIFHCFGCGEGGDVFTFLMKVGHFSFPQAVEELAKRYGVKLPSRELSTTQKKEMAKREALFQINQIASEYFHDLLTKRREGEEGRRYLSQGGSARRSSRNTDWDIPLTVGMDWSGISRKKRFPSKWRGNWVWSFPRRKSETRLYEKAGTMLFEEGSSFPSSTSING